MLDMVRSLSDDLEIAPYSGPRVGGKMYDGQESRLFWRAREYD